MFFLSWRQLMARKKQTLLILLGISFGTLLFVAISGVQLGMRNYFSEQLLNNTAHVLISGAENKIDSAEVSKRLFGEANIVKWVSPPSGKRSEVRLQNYQGWVQRLEDDINVVDYSPRLQLNVLLSRGDFSTSAMLTGAIPDRHARISKIESYVRQGSFNALRGGSNNIVIGSGVAEKLGAQLDDYVQVSSGPSGSRPFKIVGIVHYGNEQMDDVIAFAQLTNVQTLAKAPGRVSEIAVALTDLDNSTDIADQWQALSLDKVQDWKEANKAFMEMIKVQDFTRYFITTAVLVVAAFGVYNVLTIMISQKRREIAILRAIGYNPSRILLLILYQGLLLGFAGGALGLLLGFLMCLWVGSIDFGFEIGGKNNLWISYDTSIYVTAFITANVASIFASYLPARAGSRMTPMDIIRSE
jgi:lipoprotein-releasing system permease protein